MSSIPDRRGVVVCKHILDNIFPIAFGRRDDPVEKSDSGWSFMCSQDHKDIDMKLLSIEEILAKEPNLASIIDLPPGTALTRKDLKSSWEKQTNQ